jgi:cell division protein ZapE
VKVGSEHEVVAAVSASATRAGIALDSGQQRLLDRLATVAGRLDRGSARRSKPCGLYIHGDAGRGKSWLVDTFYAALPTKRKTRVHIHSFLDELHRSIHDHRYDNKSVQSAIDKLIGASRLLVFDELHVHDSGDARLLTRLLEHSFRRGLAVIATSNYAPSDLLPNPIWHHTVEPGIELIVTNMEIFHLEGSTDYRTADVDHSSGFAAGTWTTTPATLPHGNDAETAVVRGRRFPVLAVRPGELWVSYAQLCDAPTSTVEYLEWARTFRRWTITNIPLFNDADSESQQRFINLVDVLVDADVRVDFSSGHELSAFLAVASHRPDAFRMASRLQLLRNGSQ